MLLIFHYLGNPEKTGSAAMAGPKKAGSAVSRLAWGCAMCWLMWKGEQRGAQQDFSPHTC